jgi:adenylyltransferase/sulfurtransferase
MNVPLEISVAEASRLLNESPCRVRLIDVREPYEVEIASVPGAELIPMRQIPSHLPSLPRENHFLVICHHGARSMRVTEYLRHQGFLAVTNVAGGIDAWAEQIAPTMRRY